MRGGVSILYYFPRVKFVSPFLKSSYNSLLPLFCNHKNLPYSFKDIYLEKQEGFPNKGFKQLLRGCCLFSQCRNAAYISKNLWLFCLILLMTKSFSFYPEKIKAKETPIITYKEHFIELLLVVYLRLHSMLVYLNCHNKVP